MKIITKKQINFFRWFLLISGLGAVWLTFMWYQMTFGSDGMGGGNFSTMTVFYYYLFNSFILIISALVFSFRFFKAYAVFAIILAISVTGSLFVFENGQNLFFVTTMLGMTMGAAFGGPILVPMFLGSVYIGVFRSIKHIFGKLEYSLIDIKGGVVEGSNLSAINQEGPILIMVVNERSSIQKNIPILALFYAGIKILFSIFTFISSLRMSEGMEYDFSPGKVMIFSLLPTVVLIILAVASLKAKNRKAYTILNVLIVLPLLMYIMPMIYGLSALLNTF